jgi:hypothetical protein
MSGQQYDILSEHLRGANFLYAPEGEGSSKWIQSKASDGHCQQVITELSEISQRLAEIPHDESGLNIPRVSGFFERHGLNAKPFVGIDEDGQQDINDIMGFGRGPTETVASHFPLLGFTYVLRKPDETAEEFAIRETSVVHETSHANQPYRDILTFRRPKVGAGIGYTLLRNGFTAHAGKRKGGSYFEEGFASVMSHKYMTEELGLSSGFLDITKPYELRTETDDKYLLPGSYLCRGSEEGWVRWAPSAHAAYGMQLLIAKDPAIFPALLASRTGVDGMREFIGRVKALDAGIYGELRNQPYEEMRFRQATHYIIERLYDGNQQVALAAASEQDSGSVLIAA